MQVRNTTEATVPVEPGSRRSTPTDPNQAWARSAHRGLAALAIAGLFVSLGGTQTAQAQPDCGCGQTIEDVATALADERIEAVVWGTVVFAEGSPRPAPERLESNHPYPWLRYFLLVERAWKADVPSLWIERLWGRCGSPLTPGRRILLTLPKGEEPQATVIAGMRAKTLDACQLVLPEARAAEAIAALGEPLVTRDLNAEAQAATPPVVRSMMMARRQCLGEVESVENPISMVPGEFTSVELPLAGGTQTWNLGQNGTSSQGTGELILGATNPTPCWIRVVPEVRARWAVEGSARRLLASYSGMTWREGWVPPYWSGTVSLGDQHPWIRTARLRVETHSMMPSPRNTLSRSAEAAGSRTLRIEELAPLPGRLIDEKTRVRATVRWLGSAAGRHVVRPVFEAKDSSLVMSTEEGQPREWDLTANESTEISFGLGRVFTEHDLREPLQLRFVVDRLGPDGARDTVDSTQPLVFGRGTEPEPIPVPPPSSGPWFSGGDGSSCEQAVKIRGVDTTQGGIAAERAWWRKEFPGSKMVRQGVSGPSEEDERVYDLITLETRGGEEVGLCFDITEFFGKRAR